MEKIKVRLINFKRPLYKICRTTDVFGIYGTKNFVLAFSREKCYIMSTQQTAQNSFIFFLNIDPFFPADSCIEFHF